MNALDWLKASTRYTFDDATFNKILTDRGISPDTDIISVGQEEKDLMMADIIFTATFLSPSSTSSLQQSHNGYQKSIGSESDYRFGDKLAYALLIYKRYGDAKAEIIEQTKKKIRFIPIVDVNSL